MLTDNRIYILDGAFGTMAQALGLPQDAYVLDGHLARGCNDVLCLTHPEAVASIHRKYLEAGADIIETNSFNSNSISLADYDLGYKAEEISRAAARIARECADAYSTPERPRYVAGSMGPTNRTLSMSVDVNAPEKREISFDQMRQAYIEQARGLIEGGADMLLIETAFDTLNAKAAISAIRSLYPDVPIMISATLSDASGRTLSGQTIEAFWHTVAHAKPLSVGLNCGFGARHLLPYMRRLADIANVRTSVHPNAGLPNEAGAYEETPETFAHDLEQYFAEGLVNIVGGCCGTTPEHIAALAQVAKSAVPRQIPQIEPCTVVTGLEPLRINKLANFINVGERTNVAGSAKFAKLIREGDFDQAIAIARAQVEAGAQIIDVCMDADLIDSPSAMHEFLCRIAAEPEIARVPVMIDSSHWPTILAGLKCVQGKSIVNSISLKAGEDAFLEHARTIMDFGAAAVVMLFDEKGQADTYARKIEVAQRAYKLLTGIGFPAEDIIFDPNILAVATGIPEHDRFALDFIHATRWIKENLPQAKVSGGVSNLSFAFRGNNDVRKAMHSVFLYHAINAGMDMAIVNPQMVQLYVDIEPELLQRIEDVILYRRDDASDRLSQYALELVSRQRTANSEQQTADSEQRTANSRQQSVDSHCASIVSSKMTAVQRLERAMLKGDSTTAAADALQAYQDCGDPIAVINDVLMPAMTHVGDLFAAGQMFLPQVVKSARVMKQAVSALEPYIQQTVDSEQQTGDKSIRHSSTVVLATVKGDVHDIGKNIVGVVLACNGCEVIDMGVMVEPEAIIAKAQEVKADAIGLSGLITPSLDEMANVAKEAERQGLKTPIIIGGATTSPMHTALKIATVTSAPVVHSRDAADTARIVDILTKDSRNAFIADNAASQDALRQEFAARQGQKARRIPLPHDSAERYIRETTPTLAEIVPQINWSAFFAAWGIPGKLPEIFNHPEKGAEAKKLYSDAQAMLQHIIDIKALEPRGVVRRYKAHADGADLVLTLPCGCQKRIAIQTDSTGHSAADKAKGEAVLFVLSAAFGASQLADTYRAKGDDYSAIMVKFLADRLTEAYADTVLRGGCRLAVGYPALPDHKLKRTIFDLLDAEKLGFSLTESCMIIPGESICGIYL